MGFRVWGLGFRVEGVTASRWRLQEFKLKKLRTFGFRAGVSDSGILVWRGLIWGLGYRCAGVRGLVI